MSTKKNTTEFAYFIILDEHGDQLDDSSTETMALASSKAALAGAYMEDNNNIQVGVYKLIAVMEVDETNPPMPTIERIF